MSLTTRNVLNLIFSFTVVIGALACLWLYHRVDSHQSRVFVGWLITACAAGFIVMIMEGWFAWRRRRHALVRSPWWRTLPNHPIKRLAPSRPPLWVKLCLLPVLMATWVPLLFMTSSLWEILLLLMAVACWQQAQSEHRGWLRASAEQLGWLFADIALIVLFPRNGDVGTFSLLGVAAMGSLAWMMMVARGQWRLLWSGLFVMLGALPMAGHLLHVDALLWVELALVLGVMVFVPALSRIEKKDEAPWPKNHAPHMHFWARMALVALCVAAGWWVSGLVTRPNYAFNLGSENLNQSGPHDDGGDTIVFAVRIGKQDSDAQAKLYDTSDWYWRGNVLYTLDGAMWRRPPARTQGYNADYPYPRHITWKDPGIRYYLITWAGPMGARVWLDRPVSSETIDGGSVPLPAEASTAPPPPPGAFVPPPAEPYTRDGILREDQNPDSQWRPWFYPGIAALNEPFEDSGQQAEDMAWSLNLTRATINKTTQARQGDLENARTRTAAQQVFNHLAVSEQTNPAVFVKAWESYLDAHTVYDLDRTAAGAEHDVADAFLFGAPTPHGTCVDFATSTVIALRQVGIAARYVTGFQGGTWNPYLKTWVVTNGQAHAWVEYFQPQTQSWLRTDPTFAIHRVVRTNPPIRDFTMWLQSLTNNHLSPIRMATQGHSQANLLAWVSDIPLPSFHLALWVRVATVLSLGSFLIVLTLIMVRGWRKTHPQPWNLRRLARTQRSAQHRLAQHDPAAIQHDHEGLSAWAKRVQDHHPEWGDLLGLAALTQRLHYGSQNDRPNIHDLRRQWQRVGREAFIQGR